jgi:hypothetical protein
MNLWGEGRKEIALHNLVDTLRVETILQFGNQESVLPVTLDMVSRFCSYCGGKSGESPSKGLRREMVGG